MEDERQSLLIGGLIAVLLVTLLIVRDSFTRSATALSSEDLRARTRLVTFSTPTPRPMPSPTPAPAVPPGYRMLPASISASWTPDGQLFIVPPQPYRLTGERVGNRCRIELSPEPNSDAPPQPWAACTIVQ
jgi:hypothetical protein